MNKKYMTTDATRKVSKLRHDAPAYIEISSINESMVELAELTSLADMSAVPHLMFNNLQDHAAAS